MFLFEKRAQTKIKDKIKGMASYHLTAKVGSKGMGAAHSDYIERSGKNAKHKDLEHSENGNLPGWANGKSSEFWKAADEFERANGSAYREIEIALPRELTPEQRLELVREFISQEIGDKHAYSFAIHCPIASLDKAKGEQPHAHIMYSERLIDGIERPAEQYFKRYNAKNPENGGLKKDIPKDMVEKKEQLIGQRERWANLQNAHLEKHGHESKVDHRTLEEQGIKRNPLKHLPHLGQAAIALMKSSISERYLMVKRRGIELAKEALSKAAELRYEKRTEKPLEPIKTIEPVQIMAEHEKTLAERVSESMNAILEFIGERGIILRNVNVESSEHRGKVVFKDEHHLVQEIGRNSVVTHELNRLNEVPEIHEKAVIRYKKGEAKVEFPDRQKHKEIDNDFEMD